MLRFRGHVQRMGGGEKRSFVGLLPDQFDSYKYKDQIVPARYFRLAALLAKYYILVMIVCLVVAIACGGAILGQSGQLGINLDYNQFRLNDDPLTQKNDLQHMVLSELSLASRPVSLGSVNMPLQSYHQEAGGFVGHARKLLAYLSDDHFLLIYRRKDSGNILSRDSLQQVYSLERYLLQQLEWQKYCVRSTTDVDMCDVQDGYQSVFNYVGVVGHVQDLNFTQANLYARSKIARFNQFFDESYSAQKESAKYLITYLTADHFRTLASNKALFEQFDTMIEDLQDSEWEMAEEGGSQWPDIEVIWMGGTANFEFSIALKHDLLFAILSFSLVWIYGVIHTGSFFLASLGLLGVIMSFPLTILATMAVFGKIFGFVDIVSLWIMAGIGINNIFVFLDSWKSTPRHDVFNRPVSLAHRLSTTFKKATPVMFSCTITTGGAFFADFVTSRVTPISEFGFFMFFVIFLNYFHVMTWFPAVIIAHEKLPYCCSQRCRLYKKEMAAIREEDVYRRKLYLKFLWIHSARRALAQSRGVIVSVKNAPANVKEASLFPLSTTPHFLAPYHTGKAKLMFAYGDAIHHHHRAILILTIIIVGVVGSQLAFIGAPKGPPQLLKTDSNFERVRVVQTAINVKGFVGGSMPTGFAGEIELVQKGNISYSIRQDVRTLSSTTSVNAQVFVNHLFPTNCSITVGALTSAPMAVTLNSGKCNSVVDCAPFPYILPFFGLKSTPLIQLPAQPKFNLINCEPSPTGGLDLRIDIAAANPKAWNVAALFPGPPLHWVAVANTAVTTSTNVILHVDPGLLRENQLYQFRVQAVGSNPAEVSQIGPLSSACAPIAFTPRAVVNLTFIANATSFIARWAFPDNFDGGSPLTGLSLSMRQSTFVTTVYQLGLQSTSYEATSLMSQTQYTVTITGTNARGTGIGVLGLVSTLPLPPDPVDVISFGGYGRRLLSQPSKSRRLLSEMCYPFSAYPYPNVVVSWQPPDPNDVFGITEYELKVNTPSTNGFTCPSNEWIACDVSPPIPSCTVALVYNIPLTIQVRSKNTESWSDWSAPVLTPLLFYQPEPPRILRLVAQNCSIITLAWDTNTNNGPDPLTYTIYQNSVASIPGISTAFLAFPRSALYVSYTVRACNSIGCSSPSNALNVPGSGCPTPSPTTAPSSQPTNNPTTTPSSQPTNNPTTTPSSQPTNNPTTLQPTDSPTSLPSSQPTNHPSTHTPTSSPTTNQPVTSSPSRSPTASLAPTEPTPPTNAPTWAPSSAPTTSPTIRPSSAPSTFLPSAQPTLTPTFDPTASPVTLRPTTVSPTIAPTPVPSTQGPIFSPSLVVPSTQPTRLPTFVPSTSTPTTSIPTHVPSTLSPSTQTPSQFPTTVQPTTAPSTRTPTRRPTISFSSVSLTSSMEVFITWGVVSLDTSTATSDRLGTPIHYPYFNIQNTSAQIFLRDACETLMNNPKLYIRSEIQGTRCLFAGFANTQPLFPISDPTIFDTRFIAYLDAHPEFYNDVGFVGSTSNATFVSMRIVTTVPSTLNAADMEVIVKSYQNAMDSLNARAPPSVGPGYATASQWPQMAAKQHFIESTIDAIIISLVICFLAFAIFTENIYLAIYTTIFLMLECVFMLGIFGSLRWSLGAIEAVSLSIIIGLSANYFLHVAHWYSRTLAHRRRKKTLEMLSKIGCSIFSAAAVAILACGVLGFCELFVFARVGTIISVTILTAVCLSLVSLVALFFMIGPEYKNGWVGKLWRHYRRQEKQHENLLNVVTQMQIFTARRLSRKVARIEEKVEEEIPPCIPPSPYRPPAWLPPLFDNSPGEQELTQFSRQDQKQEDGDEKKYEDGDHLFTIIQPFSSSPASTSSSSSSLFLHSPSFLQLPPPMRSSSSSPMRSSSSSPMRSSSSSPMRSSSSTNISSNPYEEYDEIFG